ncbi:MAG: CsgG/HfaB family protein [bacterium]
MIKVRQSLMSGLMIMTLIGFYGCAGKCVVKSEKGNLKPRIAVADFDALAPFPRSEATVISNFVRTDIVTAGRFNVVDKNSMDKVLAEQGFQQTETSSAESAIRLGKILNVKMIINGSCSQLLGRYVITMNVVNVESAKIVYSDDISVASPDELRDAVREMVEKFSRTIR